MCGIAGIVGRTTVRPEAVRRKAIPVCRDRGLLRLRVRIQGPARAGRSFGAIDRFIWHNELPIASTSQYAQWCVFESAGKHVVTVLLDGQGADEILGGYERYFAAYLASLRQSGESRLADEERRRIAEAWMDRFVTLLAARDKQTVLGVAQ